MPKTNRKLTRAVIERRDSTGETYTQAREGVLATLSLPEKERQAHAFAAAVALRMAHAGEDADRAATSVQEIQDLAQCNGWPFADAQVEYDSPLNQIMCDKCGWTNGMVCPECPGCGCYNDRCTGWRHDEFMSDDERRERNECPECGGNMQNHYECTCYDDVDDED
ncbi:hypothetical protein ACIBSS_32085 [Micromonospora aurantiaca]|uniref:hypothetical protein n=1 Tax=Micromonospora aurantiaca (nom. illeg.) TaxID=47850 RepID=UPI000828CFA1|nr:hypothetical protein [Micromonospora aurantiaca]SCL43713.1 replication restart DNA helicase PriA [Micromonospora aurantiaca]